MKKAILTVAIFAAFTANAFASKLDGIKAINKTKMTQIKGIKAEMKGLRELVAVAKQTERTKKLDEQLEAAKEKLAEMKATASAAQ